MSDGERNPSFWETIPGYITAIGILLSGVAALITALYTAGMIGGPTKPETSPTKAKVAQAGTVQPATPPVDKAEVQIQPVSKKEPPSPAKPKQGDVMIDSVTGMKLVYMPKGCFMMGSNNGDDDEKPAHKVCVDGFWMGKYEITQGQWQKIMGSNPAKYKKGDSYPVEQVSWNDTQKFLVKLKGKSSKSYQLPTEAEWEYACRANGSGKYCGGDNLDDLAWYRENSGKNTHPVGKKQANDFGLYDMSGNVWEWCADRYDADYYSASPQDNPIGSSSGLKHSIRGGGWLNGPEY
ncbi:MAG: formylglycine-generating enzyme family protein, partial [Candidatus Electrothrix sp.]